MYELVFILLTFHNSKNINFVHPEQQISSLKRIFLYDDKYLLSELKQGSIKAFEAIYHKYKTKLYFFVLKHIRSHHETEEMIQQVFLILWECRNKLDDSKSLKSFLYTIIVNKVYNAYKQKAIRNKHLEIISSNPAENNENTYQKVYYNELQRNLEIIIKQLPAQQQKIFRLSRWEGLSNKEIAAKLNLSVRSVENQIYRAIRFIKSNLSKDFIIMLFILMSITFYV